jgi:hypothetical protein
MKLKTNKIKYLSASEGRPFLGKLEREKDRYEGKEKKVRK